MINDIIELIVKESSIIMRETFAKEYRITVIDYEKKSRCTDILKLTGKERKTLIHALGDPEHNKAIFHKFHIDERIKNVEFFKDGAIATV